MGAEIMRHIERELIETGLGGTLGRIEMVRDRAVGSPSFNKARAAVYL